MIICLIFDREYVNHYANMYRRTLVGTMKQCIPGHTFHIEVIYNMSVYRIVVLSMKSFCSNLMFIRVTTNQSRRHSSDFLFKRPEMKCTIYILQILKELFLDNLDLIHPNSALGIRGKVKGTQKFLPMSVLRTAPYKQTHSNVCKMVDNDGSFRQRTVIKFLVKEEKSAAEIHLRLQRAHGDVCMGASSVRRWVKHFEDGNTSIQDEPRSGRPRIASTERNKERVDEFWDAFWLNLLNLDRP
ncbi:hypothetical protein ANN_25288 [Periplaneta americana]|uniref:Mos1 transposase HTH domain-containing protein n=1 Tax=Periplaneta americana TaxID=6978 RepID=A0ABQ8S194_PERAM|nr:hypothetical protein ANN_25288 [Periplaneta americana]